MAALNEIKKQIQSIQKTAQITNAMRLISTTKYNRIVDEAKKYNLYRNKVKHRVSETIYHLMTDAFGEPKELPLDPDKLDFHDLLKNRPVKRKGYLIVTANQGLAGSYNAGLLKRVNEEIKGLNKEDVVLLTIGKAGRKFANQKGYQVAFATEQLSDFPHYSQVQSIVQTSVNLFAEGEYDALYLCYNHSVNALQTEIRIEQILPLSQVELANINPPDDRFALKNILVEPSTADVLDALLPIYAQTTIYGAIIDAKTAEQSSRMQAMGQATDNAEKLVDRLQQVYHRERQKRITNEMIEISNAASRQI